MLATEGKSIPLLDTGIQSHSPVLVELEGSDNAVGGVDTDL